MSGPNNTYGMSKQTLNLDNMYANNYGYMPNQGHVQPPPQPIQKERLRLKMTNEEKYITILTKRGHFGNLFSIADKAKAGKLAGKEAAEFLKRSGLPKDMLKTIWIIAAQTDPQHLERDEFYIALRLIALAQNKMEVSEESIRLNHPLPPLPKFDLKNSQPNPDQSSQSINPNMSVSSGSYPGVNESSSFNLNSSRSIPTNVSSSGFNSTENDLFVISEQDTQKYFALFSKNKDMENRMSLNKALEMFQTVNIPNEVIQRILAIVPLKQNNSFSFNEFRVVFHLIYKYYQINDVPSSLPNSLRAVLNLDNTNEDQPAQKQEIDFGQKLGFSSSSQGVNPLQASDATANFNMMGNNPVSQGPVSTNISDMNMNNNSQYSDFSKNSANTFSNNPPTNTSSRRDVPAASLAEPLNSARAQINDKFNSIHNYCIQENQSLNRELEEDKNLLNSLLQDVEKVNKSIAVINEKNRELREFITETRRRINIERDNLSKATSTLAQKTNELAINQSKLDF